MNILSYITDVVMPVIYVSAISITVAAFAKYYLGNGIWQSLTEIAICLVTTGLAVLLLGMTKTERKHFWESVLNKLSFHKQQVSK